MYVAGHLADGAEHELHCAFVVTGLSLAGPFRHEVLDLGVHLLGQLLAELGLAGFPEQRLGTGQGARIRGVAHDVEDDLGAVVVEIGGETGPGEFALELEGQGLGVVLFGKQGLDGFTGLLGVALLDVQQGARQVAA